MESIVILGSGIAGCTAAIYTARANLAPLVLSGPQDGGQLTLTSEVENFPGFPDGIDGTKLVEQAKAQAQRFGARFELDLVESIEKQPDNSYTLKCMTGKIIQTKTLIVATGASARWLNIPSQEKYKGRGVTTCATCDGAFFKDKEVIVVGGGDSAMEEALFLTKYCTKITIVHRRDTLRASQIMQERAQKHPQINFLWNNQVKEIYGEKTVQGVKLESTKDSSITDFKCDGVFLAIGHVPNTTFLKGLVDLDDHGYLKATPFMHTNHPGIFAAGDVQDTRYRQAITAAGSGCQAAMEVEKYLADQE